MLITNDLHPLIQKSSCALWGMQHMSSKLVTICFSERTVPQPFPFSVSINGSLLKQSGLTIYSAFVEGFVKGRVIFGFLLILCILFLKGFRQLFLLENFTSESMSKSLPSSWWKRQGHLPHNFFSQVCIGKINKNQGYKKTQPTFTTIYSQTLCFTLSQYQLVLLLKLNGYSTGNKMSLPCLLGASWNKNWKTLVHIFSSSWPPLNRNAIIP